MSYSFYTKKQHIPLPVAFLGTLILALCLVFVFKQGELPTKKEVKIESTEIGNITFSTAGIYWRSDIPAESYLIYGKSANSLDTKAFEVQDKTNFPKSRQNHLVLLSNLDPDETYFFKLVNNETSRGASSDSPFSFKTARKTSQTSDRGPAFGKVVDSHGKALTHAIVIVEPALAVKQITMTNSDGTFLLSLCCLYEKTSLKPLYESIPADEIVKFKIIDDSGDILAVEKSINDVSPIVDNLVMNEGKTEIAQAKTLGESDQFLKKADGQIYQAIDFIYPKKDAQISSSRPLFKGVAFPDKVVEGKILPEERNFTVTTDEKGLWNFSPSIGLLFGKHTVKISTNDDHNQKVNIERDFFVMESGSSVLAEATGGATLTPPQVTTSVSVTPTEIIETPVVTLVPTLSPTGSLTPTPTPPITGPNIIPAAIFSTALVIIGMGFILLF